MMILVTTIGTARDVGGGIGSRRVFAADAVPRGRRIVSVLVVRENE